MAYTTINDPSAHFQTALYSGTGSAQSITNNGNSNLQPDWVWWKRRDAAYSHGLVDSNRGTGKYLRSDSSNAEGTDYTYITSFDSDGFTIPSGDQSSNNSSGTYVAWQWKAAGGTTASNSNGSITSTVQANTTAGFSIVTYTGDGATSATVGHGLGAVPKMIISKERASLSNVTSWRVYHQDIGNTKYIQLDTSGAAATFDDWGNTTPTSTVYTIGGSGGYRPTNTSSRTYVAYVFAEKQGYSKFGKYTGNGNANGTFVFTGFKPNFVMLRETGNTNSWWMFDTARDTYNTADARLAADTTAAEATGSFTNVIDFLSNGFKLRNTDSAWNRNNGTYIYMCFAENPFVTSTGTPTTAR